MQWGIYRNCSLWQTIIMVYSDGMTKPKKSATFIRPIIAEAKRRGWTAYRLKLAAGIPLSTAQRLLANDLNPTASTVEAVAKALGLTITVAKD